MIERIPGLPGNVLGISASGTVTAADYESIVIPAVEEMLKQHDKLNLLYHLGPDTKGFEMGAVWDDARVGWGHYAAWDKIAVVSDIEWIRGLAAAMDYLFPAYVRVFHDTELEDAKTWISE